MLAVALATLPVLPLGARADDAQAQRVPASTLLERLHAYLADYGQRYASTVAAEHYVQTSVRGGVELDSEFGITQMNGSWTGIRDVLRVNDRPVPAHDARLAAVFANTDRATARVQADRIAAESARYNIGPIACTINNPAIVLALLDSGTQDRVQFEAPDAPATDTAPVRVRFRERARPTVFRTEDGMNEPAEGTLYVDAASGRIARAEISMTVFDTHDSPGAIAAIDVTYGAVAQLDVRVPLQMRETYTAIGGRLLATGLVTYSNYRQFHVATSDAPAVPR